MNEYLIKKEGETKIVSAKNIKKAKKLAGCGKILKIRRAKHHELKRQEINISSRYAGSPFPSIEESEIPYCGIMRRENDPLIKGHIFKKLYNSPEGLLRFCGDGNTWILGGDNILRKVKGENYD